MNNIEILNSLYEIQGGLVNNMPALGTVSREALDKIDTLINRIEQ